MNTPLDNLITLFAKLPGLGPRSARRVVLHLLRNRENALKPLLANLSQTAQSISECHLCGNMDTVNPCTICSDPKRDKTRLCVVEDIADLWAIERSQMFNGEYHVLGGVLSALDGIGPEQLKIDRLIARSGQPDKREVIIATNATVEGQTTAHYISSKLAGYPLTISRPAQGIPLGGELDYLDDGTLNAAFKARLAF